MSDFEPRHTPEEHLTMAEDILDAVGMAQPLIFQSDQEAHMAWAARAQASAFLAGAHIVMAAILTEE